MKLNRTLALLGNLGAQGTRAVNDAAKASNIEVVRFKSSAELVASMHAKEPIAILVASDSDSAFECCVDVRGRPAFAHVPILGIGTRKTNLSFVQLYQWGGDDLISIESEAPLARRLRALVASPPRPAEDAVASRGEAIVASSDTQWSTILARSLANAGYAPRFVTNAADVVEQSREAKVVIAADDLAPLGAEFAVATSREAGIETPWVFVAAPRRLASSRQAVVGLTRVVVLDAFSPPENVLFATNELARNGDDQRLASRLLFGTNVSFRAAGRDEDDDTGFTYNVSTTGMYVRTLAPLAAGVEVWLELWAPKAERRVRLVGTVAWQRRFGPNDVATVPAGFGVHLTDGLGADLRRWREGCEALAKDEGRLSTVPPAPRPSVVLTSLLQRAMI